ncbi:protein turtle homolog B-like [Brevipalpus obovatus]|uniref:protein turtle homolog B-like n=1 Tax=Brevipalpus obovatus TaxID=246614 RepID=UPI003D9E03ED
MMIVVVLQTICLLSMLSISRSQDIPEISLNHQKLTQKVGKPAHFLCSLEKGNLPVTFEWLKDGVLLKSSPKIAIGTSERISSLTLESAARSDAGNYTCRALNSFGSRISTASLLVEGPPQWLSKPIDIRVGPKEKFSLKCSGVAHPSPTTSWKKLIDSEWQDLFASTTNFIRISSTEISCSQLVKERDEGKYGCEISNGMNPNLWVEFKIEVSGKINDCFPVRFSLSSSHALLKKMYRHPISNQCK